jgi:hypothetical protein
MNGIKETTEGDEERINETKYSPLKFKDIVYQ